MNDAAKLTLAEDAEDLAAFEDRAREPNLPFESVAKDLKKAEVLAERTRRPWLNSFRL